MTKRKTAPKDDESSGGSALSQQHPRLFVSYSWSSPEHQEWVIGLATQLREAGVDVILDKWDLREGQDAHVFMEKMVTDPEVQKVIMICDQTYVEKADGRAGGVGTETQIISAKVYGETDQSKFVAVVRERDEHGKPLRPAYYHSRIHIDMSQPEAHSASFEQLLRWVYDKPHYVKPGLGAPPAFLADRPGVALGTSLLASRAIDAVRNGRDHADGAIAEYFIKFAEALEQIRIGETGGEFDDAVIESIDSFLPARNEMNNVIAAIAQYRPNAASLQSLQRFFEQLIPYMTRSSHVQSWKDWDFDNFRFVTHEMFLYALAILLRHERFEPAASLIHALYYVGDSPEFGDERTTSSATFRRHLKSLEYRNKRLEKRRVSPRADLLKERCRETVIHFEHLMQADFVMYVYHSSRGQASYFDLRWWPDTLLYASRPRGPLEIFARSRSTAYFNKAKVLLGIAKKEDLLPFFEAIQQDRRLVPQWQFESISPSALLGYEQLATVP